MLSHMVSTQQLMFLYQYLVYLYQFKRKKEVSMLFTVVSGSYHELFSVMTVLSRGILQRVTRLFLWSTSDLKD